MDVAKNFLVLWACQWSDLEQPTSHLASCDPRGLPASWDLPEHRVLWTFPCSHSNVLVRGCRECAKQWEYPAEETRQFSRHLQCRIKELRLTHSEAACKSKPSYSRIERSHHTTPAPALKERRENVAYEGISILTNKISSAKLRLYSGHHSVLKQYYPSCAWFYVCIYHCPSVEHHLYKISVYK